MFHESITNPQQIQTPYEGRVLQLSVSFPEAYPFDAPKVTFTSRVYHLNVDAKGEIRLNALQDKWAPNMNMHESTTPFEHLGCLAKLMNSSSSFDSPAAYRAEPRLSR